MAIEPVADDASQLVAVSATAAPNESEQLIDLPAGGDLNQLTGGQITSAFLTRLVLLAGEAESGKTTLLSAIYESFNEGPFAGLIFAGSKSLVGWERRCHLARIASGSEKAETERTLGLDQRLLHLRLREENAVEAAQHVLFTDLSGEVFQLVKDSTEECQQLGMLKRADHFVLLLDCRKLIAKTMRQSALTNGTDLMRSCVDAGMIGERSFVDVVFSKYDLVSPSDDNTLEFLKHSEETFKNRFAARVGRLRFHKTAARPKAAGFEYAFGISDLLRSWFDDSPYLVGNLQFAATLEHEASEFDNFLRVQLPSFTEIRAWK